MSRVLLLGAGGPAGENFTQCCHMAGHVVAGVDPDPWARALSSADWTEPRADDQDHHCDFAHAQPDEEVLRLATDPSACATLLPDAETIEVCQDKLVTATRIGDLAPESVAIWEPEDVEAAFSAWGWPIWFRARKGAGSYAALPVEGIDIGIAWLRFWSRRGVRLMASRYLPGANLSWTGVYSRGGELVASATKERIELLGASRAPSGVSSTARVQKIVYRPDVAAFAKQAVEALTPNPRGVFMVDLSEDADGRPFVTEINAGRFGTTSLFFAETGGNLPAVLVALGTGEDPPCEGDDVCEIGAVQVRNTDMGSRVLDGVMA